MRSACTYAVPLALAASIVDARTITELGRRPDVIVLAGVIRVASR